MSDRIKEFTIKGRKALLFKNGNMMFSSRHKFDYTNTFDLNFMAYFTSGMYEVSTTNGSDVIFLEKENNDNE